MPGQEGTGCQWVTALRLELKECEGGLLPCRNDQAILRRFEYLTGHGWRIVRTRSRSVDDFGTKQKITDVIEVTEGVRPRVQTAYLVVDLRRRFRPIDPAVVTAEPWRECDLVRILVTGDNPARIKRVDRLDQQFGTKLGEARLQADTRFVWSDWNWFAAKHRSSIHLAYELDNCDATLFFAGHDCPMNRCGAPVLWKE